jgi:hypothetical protein
MDRVDNNPYAPPIDTSFPVDLSESEKRLRCHSIALGVQEACWYLLAVPSIPVALGAVYYDAPIETQVITTSLAVLAVYKIRSVNTRFWQVFKQHSALKSQRIRATREAKQELLYRDLS